jgi:signal transduction histidine kinase
MRRVDRLASLGTLTAGLAHEIRNPLVSIKTFLQLLPERFDDEEFRTYFLNLTVEEVERISSLLSELLDFARPSEPNFQKADINEIMEKVVLLADKEISKKSLVVHKQCNIDLPKVVVDRAQMKQVFLNIFLNAIQASSERGEIFIETRFLDIGEKFVQIIVRDKGEGISEKDIENIFTPFFTMKSGGTGLGLSISHQIVQEHRGTINVKSRPGKGSTFTINLPLNSMDYKKRNELSPEEEVMEGTIR